MHIKYVWLTDSFVIQKGGMVTASFDSNSSSVLITDTHDKEHTVKNVTYEMFDAFIVDMQDYDTKTEIVSEPLKIVTSKKVAKKTTRRTNGETKQDKGA